MANLLEIADLAYRQVFPEPRENTSITLIEFIQTAKNEYAAAMLIYQQEQIRMDGYFQMPSELLDEKEFDISGKTLDISSLKPLASFQGDLWLQGISSGDCDCVFTKTTYSLSKTLCGYEEYPDSHIPYYIVGSKIKFLKEPPAKKVSIVYANNGSGVDPKAIIVNDYVASKVREKLIRLYGNKASVDVTQNQMIDN